MFATSTRLEGFKHIVDDGDCTEHGYFLPKQPVRGAGLPSEGGVAAVDVPQEELVTALRELSTVNAARVAALKS